MSIGQSNEHVRRDDTFRCCNSKILIRLARDTIPVMSNIPKAVRCLDCVLQDLTSKLIVEIANREVLEKLWTWYERWRYLEDIYES